MQLSKTERENLKVLKFEGEGAKFMFNALNIIMYKGEVREQIYHLHAGYS